MGKHFLDWPNKVEHADFVVTTCALTKETKHMVNQEIISKLKQGVKLVNVSRGGIIDENALIDALKSKKVSGAALDVFETEPLPMDNPLRTFENCIFGTHNGSNTLEGVIRASNKAIEKLFSFLNIN